MKCKQCSCNLAKSAKFCPECGAPVPKEELKLQPMQNEAILTLNETAKLLKVSRCQVYKLIAKQGLPYFPIGSHKRFVTDEVLAWCKNRKMEGGIGA